MAPWIMIGLVGAIIVILGLIAVFVVLKKRREGIPTEPNYKAFFTIGIVFMVIGMASIGTQGTSFSAMFIMGLVFMAIGLTNKDKWKNEESQPLSRNAKIALVAGVLLLAALVIGFVLVRNGLLVLPF